MIAVFARNFRHYNDQNYLPQSMFINIKNVDSIRGRRFIGIIRMNGWYQNCSDEIIDAYFMLKERQPELFVNK